MINFKIIFPAYLMIFVFCSSFSHADLNSCIQDMTRAFGSLTLSLENCVKIAITNFLISDGVNILGDARNYYNLFISVVIQESVYLPLTFCQNRANEFVLQNSYASAADKLTVLNECCAGVMMFGVGPLDVLRNALYNNRQGRRLKTFFLPTNEHGVKVAQHIHTKNTYAHEFLSDIAENLKVLFPVVNMETPKLYCQHIHQNMQGQGSQDNQDNQDNQGNQDNQVYSGYQVYPDYQNDPDYQELQEYQNYKMYQDYQDYQKNNGDSD